MALKVQVAVVQTIGAIGTHQGSVNASLDTLYENGVGGSILLLRINDTAEFNGANMVYTTTIYYQETT